MSTLITLATSDLHTHLQAASHLVTVLPAAAGDGGGGGDILGWINGKSLQTRTTTINVGKAVLVIVLVFAMWRSRGALAAGITAAVSVAILWFVLGNIEGLSERVETEVNGMGATTVSGPVAGEGAVGAVSFGPLSNAG